MTTVDSTSDARIANNVMRHEYRLLSDDEKALMKDIKDSKLKVTAQIMDDIIRVSAKKIDDLQAVIALCRRGDYEIPLQFINMK